MRIVAVADTHLFEADLGRVPDGDVLVHAGDLCRRGTLEELAIAAGWLRALPHRHKIVIAGNHDGCFARDAEAEAARALLGDGVHYLEDSAVSIDGVRFWGSPWQPRYRDWAFNLERGAALAAKWSLIPHGTDVLVTHGPPRGFGDQTPIAGRAGCDDLLTAVRRVQPILHLFGHIHTGGGLWRDGGITYLNATTWECERAPSVLDLDIAARRVTEVSIPPTKR